MSGVHKLSYQSKHVELKEGMSIPGDPMSIGLSSGLAPQELLRFATELGFQHLCQKDGFGFDKELQSAENLILDPESFFIHPVSNILTPDLVNSEQEKQLTRLDQRFDSSDQKRKHLDDLTNYLKSVGISQTLIEDACAVADEFITNAIFNAPFIDRATNTNPGLDRLNNDIKLTDGKFGRFILGHNDQELVVGCEDPYGSLNLNHYLNKIRATYLKGAAAAMNFGSGGAGLGSFIIFNAGSSLYFGVKSGRVTLLCCTIPIRMSYKKRIQLSKHLHVIQR